jgi:hypothetical protein
MAIMPDDEMPERVLSPRTHSTHSAKPASIARAACTAISGAVAPPTATDAKYPGFMPM